MYLQLSPANLEIIFSQGQLGGGGMFCRTKSLVFDAMKRGDSFALLKRPWTLRPAHCKETSTLMILESSYMK